MVTARAELSCLVFLMAKTQRANANARVALGFHLHRQHYMDETYWLECGGWIVAICRKE